MSMPKAIPIISAFHNLSAGDLADEHGQLSAQIADLETRKRAIAGEVIRRGVSECEGALFRSIVISEAMVCTLDRPGIEREMGEAWIARFLKWSKRSAHVKTTARLAGNGAFAGFQISDWSRVLAALVGVMAGTEGVQSGH